MHFWTPGLEMFVQNGSKMEECKNRSLAEYTVGMFLYHIVRTDSDMEIKCPLSCEQHSFTINTRRYHTNSWFFKDVQPGIQSSQSQSTIKILFLGFYPKIYFRGGSLYSYIFVFFKMYYITKRLCDKTI